MDSVKKRMPLLKNLNTEDLPSPDESFSNLNLLGTIKLPKNLANLTKDLPKSNYISNRADSASVSGGHGISSGNKGKLIQGNLN